MEALKKRCLIKPARVQSGTTVYKRLEFIILILTLLLILYVQSLCTYHAPIDPFSSKETILNTKVALSIENQVKESTQFQLKDRER